MDFGRPENEGGRAAVGEERRGGSIRGEDKKEQACEREREKEKTERREHERTPRTREDKNEREHEREEKQKARARMRAGTIVRSKRGQVCEGNHANGRR
jgi:bisphosphoglycerate-dependent phosphoglycerate mutase